MLSTLDLTKRFSIIIYTNSSKTVWRNVQIIKARRFYIIFKTFPDGMTHYLRTWFTTYEIFEQSDKDFF